jgi:hypothetical protein
MSNIDNPLAALGGLSGSPDDIVKQLYGYMAWALDIPEVGDILRMAAVNGWSTDILKGKLEATNWWKTTGESERVWEQKQAEDPASAAQQIHNLASQIKTELTGQGVTIDDGRISQVAEQALRWNWNNDQTKAALDAELQRSPDLLQSKVGTNFKALAAQYAVPLSDPVIAQWAAHSVSGVRSEEQFRQYLVNQASQRFASNAQLQTFMKQGGTVSQFFDPYKQYAAQILGVNPDSIDLTDPKWTAAINARIDDKGTVGPMSYDQWISYLKTNPAYNYQATTQGKTDQANLAQTIGQLFGKVAPV